MNKNLEQKKKYINWNEVIISKEIIELILCENIFLGSTDTVLGLFAPLGVQGLEALNKLKGRSQKPYIVLVSDINQAALFSSQISDDEQVKELAHSVWPGPVTLIVRARANVQSFMLSKDGTIALRVPDHAAIRALLSKVPGLFSTSANKHGEAFPRKVSQVNQHVIDGVNYVVFDEEEHETPITPSTLIDCTRYPFHIIREGILSPKVQQLLQRFGSMR
ncbi:MAG: L-threonylcarbamoyladenylate synthase [Candidatus Babeliales bacterium]